MASFLSPSSTTVRPYRSEDEAGVRELIDADRMPGQQRCTKEKLAAARRGPPALADWAAQERPRISVLSDAADHPRGVIAFLSWPDIRTGVICWAYAREDLPALRTLLGHALAELARCRQIDAFVGAPPGPLGPGGLPHLRRAATHEALLEAGFTGHRRGAYLHCTLPGEPWPAPAKLVADVFPCECPPGHRLIIRDGAEPVAEAVVSVGPDRTATVYWIETRPTHRGRGLGRKLLGQAFALLAEQGAVEAALVIDNMPPTSESEAASRLFDSFGFSLVDELWTYQRRHTCL